jgi:GT2 family glycosyltransferase/glycosyltransferase involved in cell wall biosynthesis
LPLALLSPVFVLLAALGLLIADVISALQKKAGGKTACPINTRATIVIPNWNGKELLEKYLPSVIAAAEVCPGSEVLVVDNGSTDGSAAFLKERFPQVRVHALDRNLGFGGGSNAGFKAAKNDIIVLLNSDMHVEPDFLPPLLAGFTDEKVFAVSCQIFFSDPQKKREETGLTEAWWAQGGLRVRHRIDPAIQELYPCFYGGGGSCAFDRKKFLELGGFDSLLAPFYLEDTDLGYMAWKRGWKVLYQPASRVYHEHRGTIGKKFSDAYIQTILKKNFLLFVWKNIHDWKWLASHFFFMWTQALVSWLAGDSPERASFAGLTRAALQLPRAMRSRSRARRLATIDDREAFRRPLGGYFLDEFGLDGGPGGPLRTRGSAPQGGPPRTRGSAQLGFDGGPEGPLRTRGSAPHAAHESAPQDKLRVLFVSPYPICPPVHGGAVFMYQTVRELAKLVELHLIVMLDYPHNLEPHRELEPLCASIEYVVRTEKRHKAIGSIVPHAVREFRNPDVAWLIHRQIYTRSIDVMQLEYTVLGQYAGGFRRIPCMLFEHDVYFQSIARRLPYMRSLTEKVQARWEYLRSLRYELRMLSAPDRVQVCSRENGAYLKSFVPQLKGRVDDGFRAGIATELYDFRPDGREPLTMLFLGSFRHLPNQEALNWFVGDVLPKIRAEEPSARLIVVGSDPPPKHSMRDAEGIELVGFVEDVREPLGRYAVFVCPILSGSGMRVKLLEAFAAGIPVVSTRLGAEGLASVDGEICALADDSTGFAARVIRLLRDSAGAAELARRARADVVEKRDMRRMTERMVEAYAAEVRRMRDSAK